VLILAVSSSLLFCDSMQKPAPRVFILPLKQINPPTHPAPPIHPPTNPAPINQSKMTLDPLPLDIWYELLLLLDIKEAIQKPFLVSLERLSSQSKLSVFAMPSTRICVLCDLPVGPLASFICFLLRDSSLEFTGLLSWIARRIQPVLYSSVDVNRKLFKDLSSTFALKDRGFVSVSSSLSSWNVEMKAEDESACSISWILLFRASISGYRAADFHRACDGMGKCVVVVKTANGMIAAAYNEDVFTSVFESTSPNLNGFIASVDEEGRCGEIFNRNDQAVGIWNFSVSGPDFGSFDTTDLHI
jgi:hypothetical protein